MPPQSRQLVLNLMPSVFVLLWSTGFIGAKYGLPYAEPLTFLAVRFGAVTAILCAIAMATHAPWPTQRRDIVHSLVSGLLIHGVYLGGVFWAIALGMPAGLSALIVGVQPLLTAFVSKLTLGETVSKLQWVGIALGFGGLILVLGPRIVSASGTPIATFAIILNVAALLGITAGTIYQKRYAAFADLRSGGTLQYLAATLLCWAGALTFETRHINWTVDFLLAMGWLVIVLSLGAITLLMLLIRHGAITKVASMFYLVPPVTVLIAYFMFDEQLSMLQMSGMVLTAFAVWLASGSGQTQKNKV